MGPTGFSEAMVRDLVADLLVAVPAGRPWTARLSVSLHPFGTDPERFFRDMSVHTCLPGRNEPSFSTLNRHPWSDDQAEMVEDVAEHSLLSLTRLELESLSGLDDAVDGAQRLARAAASGEPPWTSVSMFVRGRPDQVDALRLTTPLSAVYVVALKDRMVGVGWCTGTHRRERRWKA